MPKLNLPGLNRKKSGSADDSRFQSIDDCSVASEDQIPGLGALLDNNRPPPELKSSSATAVSVFQRLKKFGRGKKKPSDDTVITSVGEKGKIKDDDQSSSSSSTSEQIQVYGNAKAPNNLRDLGDDSSTDDEEDDTDPLKLMSSLPSRKSSSASVMPTTSRAMNAQKSSLAGSRPNGVNPSIGGGGRGLHELRFMDSTPSKKMSGAASIVPHSRPSMLRAPSGRNLTNNNPEPTSRSILAAPNAMNSAADQVTATVPSTRPSILPAPSAMNLTADLSPQHAKSAHHVSETILEGEEGETENGEESEAEQSPVNLRPKMLPVPDDGGGMLACVSPVFKSPRAKLRALPQHLQMEKRDEELHPKKEEKNSVEKGIPGVPRLNVTENVPQIRTRPRRRGDGTLRSTGRSGASLAGDMEKPSRPRSPRRRPRATVGRNEDVQTRTNQHSSAPISMHSSLTMLDPSSPIKNSFESLNQSAPSLTRDQILEIMEGRDIHQRTAQQEPRRRRDPPGSTGAEAAPRSRSGDIARPRSPRRRHRPVHNEGGIDVAPEPKSPILSRNVIDSNRIIPKSPKSPKVNVVASAVEQPIQIPKSPRSPTVNKDISVDEQIVRTPKSPRRSRIDAPVGSQIVNSPKSPKKPGVDAVPPSNQLHAEMPPVTQRPRPQSPRKEGKKSLSSPKPSSPKKDGFRKSSNFMTMLEKLMTPESDQDEPKKPKESSSVASGHGFMTEPTGHEPPRRTMMIQQAATSSNIQTEGPTAKQTEQKQKSLGNHLFGNPTAKPLKRSSATVTGAAVDSPHRSKSPLRQMTTIGGKKRSSASSVMPMPTTLLSNIGKSKIADIVDKEEDERKEKKPLNYSNDIDGLIEDEENEKDDMMNELMDFLNSTNHSNRHASMSAMPAMLGDPKQEEDQNPSEKPRRRSIGDEQKNTAEARVPRTKSAIDRLLNAPRKKVPGRKRESQSVIVGRRPDMGPSAPLPKSKALDDMNTPGASRPNLPLRMASTSTKEEHFTNNDTVAHNQRNATRDRAALAPNPYGKKSLFDSAYLKEAMAKKKKARGVNPKKLNSTDGPRMKAERQRKEAAHRNHPPRPKRLDERRPTENARENPKLRNSQTRRGPEDGKRLQRRGAPPPPGKTPRNRSGNPRRPAGGKPPRRSPTSVIGNQEGEQPTAARKRRNSLSSKLNGDNEAGRTVPQRSKSEDVKSLSSNHTDNGGAPVAVQLNFLPDEGKAVAIQVDDVVNAFGESWKEY